jgi:hypothetical protein
VEEDLTRGTAQQEIEGDTSMPRTRMTWTPQPKNAAHGKSASPPPQTPSVGRTEGPDHPAFYPDPERDKYEKGDTSAWAEDPKKPMLPESAPPAMPGNLTTEPLDHPATSDFEKGADKPGKPAAVKEASLKELAERRAALCVRIASALMPGATASAVENKALDLMDFDDAKLRAAAEAIKLVAGENPFADKDEEEKDEEEDDKDGDKTASHDVTARLARLEANFGKLRKAMANFFGMDDKEDAADEMMAYLMGKDEDGDGIDQSKNDFPQGYDDAKLSAEDKGDDEDAMLKAMLDEMDDDMKASVTASHEQDVVEPLAKGQSIQSGEGGNVNADAAPKTPQVSGPMTGGTAVKAGEMPDFIKEKIEDKDEKEDEDEGKTAGEEDDDEEDTELDVDITAGEDPMGLMPDVTASDDALMQLYADLDLGRVAGEEEEVEAEAVDADGDVEEVEEEKPAKEASSKTAKTAARGKPQLRPQAKTASTGAAPKQLGNLTRAAREIDDLQKLWETAPDVSQVFGLPKG